MRVSWHHTDVHQVYFCEFIIEPYLKDPEHAKYIDTEVLDKYWDVGGVRCVDRTTHF